MVASDEELDAQHAHDAEFIKHTVCHFHSVSSDIVRHTGWRDRHIQNVPSMLVLDGAIMHELAVVAACRHHRDFTVEVDEGFEYRFFPANRVPSFGHALCRIDPKLPLAVVAERRRLEHRGTAQL